jgi:hypothetical protein
MKLSGPLLVAMALLATAPAQSRDGYADRPMVCSPADIHDQDRLVRCQDWIAKAKEPDNRNSSCCADADAYITDDYETIGGELFAITTVDYPGVPKGTKILVPQTKINRAIEDGGNPSGHSVTFVFGQPPNGQVLCYFGPTGV